MTVDRFPLSFLFSGFFFHGGNLTVIHKNRMALIFLSFSATVLHTQYAVVFLTVLFFRRRLRFFGFRARDLWKEKKSPIEPIPKEL